MTSSHSGQLMAAEVRTSLGNLSLLLDRPPSASQRPVVLMLHGLMRDAVNLADWYDIIPSSFDLVIADLPGHGRSPAQGPATVEAVAQRLRETISRHFAKRSVAVVGESVGALVALALGDGKLPEIRGVIAAEPPLTVCKLWPVVTYLTTKIKEVPDGDYRRTLFSDLLGYEGENQMREMVYYDLVRNARVPTLVLAGDMPLWPAWRTIDFREKIPSLIDDVDRYFLSLIGNEHVTFETLRDRGHVLLSDPDQATRKRISDFCETTLH